ncbi:MAG: type II toxin-antitoxin system VapC family toxin [Chthoniobacterales bacterium]|nr:type II toxin-antitoxin system VapC family toxin [Chthoniobacterales bacterium]
MVIPDANILLCATDTECPDHEAAAAWWRDTLQGDEEVGLCAVVAFAFIRLATNRKVFRRPLSVKDAGARVANWLEFPNVVWLDAHAEDFTTAAELLLHAGTGANLVTDAQIAAIALRTGGSIRSCDHDFSRFRGVDWSDPLA